MDKKIYNWIAPIFMMTVIFILSSTPGATINAVGLGKESYHIDGHFMMFVFLCLSYFKATKNILLSLFLTFSYGVLDEFHQQFTPGRSVSTFDVFVDTCGGLVVTLFVWKGLFLLPKKLRDWLLN